jgi:hypothetical protein
VLKHSKKKIPMNTRWYLCFGAGRVGNLLASFFSCTWVMAFAGCTEVTLKRAHRWATCGDLPATKNVYWRSWVLCNVDNWVAKRKFCWLKCWHMAWSKADATVSQAELRGQIQALNQTSRIVQWMQVIFEGSRHVRSKIRIRSLFQQSHKSNRGIRIGGWSRILNSLTGSGWRTKTYWYWRRPLARGVDVLP